MSGVQERYKTFWRRFFAAIIDGILVSIPVSIIGSAIAMSDVNEKRSVFEHLFSESTYVTETTILITLLTAVITVIYSVVMNGNYGGTFGKKWAGLRVVSGSDEQSVIGIPRAIRRDLPFIVMELLGIIFLTMSLDTYTPHKAGTAESIVNNLSGIWVLAELITMFSNDRRRAIHDILADSVVIKKV